MIFRYDIITNGLTDDLGIDTTGCKATDKREVVSPVCKGTYKSGC